MWRALICFLFASSVKSQELYRFERALMGTTFSIQCYAHEKSDAQQAANAAFDVAENINRIASDYIADSELLELCRKNSGEPHKVSPTLFGLLKQAHTQAELTEGAYDPTIGPLTKLWRESRRSKQLPSTTILADAKSKVGWKNIVLDEKNQTVKFNKIGMRLDLGGIAKGQAADAMMQVMKNHKLPQSCITCGGDVLLGDPPPSKNGWKVAVKTFDKNQVSQELVLKNCAVSTSGDLHQFIEINGTKYSHIIDPATGLGLTKKVACTVIAPTATESDSLATAFCVMPRKKVTQLQTKLINTRVYLCDH